MVTTGRPLDADGQPTGGPALSLDPDGPAAQRLAASSYPLASSPGMGMWSVIESYPPRDGSDEPSMVVWLAPDATELPPHYHTNGEESFRALRGEVTIVIDDEPHRLGPGGDVTIEPGREHYFRNDTDGLAAFHVEPPWARTIETQFVSFGMDHDGYFDEPDVLQGLLLSEYVSEGTKITAAPAPLQRLLWATLCPLARVLGREAVDDTYLEPAFWERTVEQPDLTD